ncbi:MAG TPA: hypothetical protein VFM38_15350 [Candidatus Limnocylindrales bacterium]|nr:hypothetical protein [Candidatus Limnocylindrales bacterium]
MRALWFRLLVALGLRTWGRQPIRTPLRMRLTTRAKVIRANGDIEDLGVVDERVV